MGWELKEWVDLIVSESIEIENNSLQVNDKYIRSLRDQYSLANIYLLLAVIAFVIVNNFSFYEFLQTIMHRFGILNSKRKVIEVFNSVFNFTAFLAD
jgi:hypothetical protein